MHYRINAPQVITETIEGEAIMINLGTGNYYSVGGCGAEVCSWLEDGANVAAIAAALAQRYEADPELIDDAVARLIRELEQEELIVPTSENGGSPIAEASSERRPFEPPRVEKYTDMQDLVLLDPVHEVGERGWPHPQPAAEADGA
jgi:hypothetical protein